MVYREVHMTEIKEILLRINRNESVRSISRTLGIHRDTINKYIDISLKLGTGPRSNKITDELVEKIKEELVPTGKNSNIPRDEILLPHKDRIKVYLEKGLKGSKIMSLLARDGILVSSLSFYRFINTRCSNYVRKNITVRLPETEPSKYCQADFGYMGRIWDSKTEKLKKTYALIITLCHSRLSMYIYDIHPGHKSDNRGVLRGPGNTLGE